MTFSEQLPAPWRRRLSRRIAIGTREVMVFDRATPRATTAVLYKFLRRTRFGWLGSDTIATEHSVRWTQTIPTTARELGMFGDVVELVDSVAAESQQLVQIYVNFNLYGEVHYAHIDAPEGITALYCANLAWKPEWQGETFFYDGDEPTQVVAPRPGRLVLFDAALHHRGSPPARDCWEPRIYIVLKFQPRRTPQPKRRARSRAVPRVIRLPGKVTP